MVYKERLDTARAGTRSVQKPHFVGRVTDLFEGKAATGPRPQSFLVEQSPNWTLPTHFHVEQQFQVFIAGSGFLGRTPIEPMTVHFATRHTGYGPLVSGAEGISYFTLRALSDTGAWLLPQSREKIRTDIKKQQVHAEPQTHIEPHALLGLTEPGAQVLIAPAQSGLAAWLLRLPPNTRVPAPAGQAQGGGRFYVVAKGSARVEPELMPAWSTVYLSPDEMPDIESGPDGLEIMVLQFPLAALEPEV